MKYASVACSYGWSSKAIEQITASLPNLKVEVLSPVLCKGAPKEDDFQALMNLAGAIAEKHKENGLL